MPYEMSQAPAIARLQSFVDEVKRASPMTTVIVPKYFDWIAVPAIRFRDSRIQRFEDQGFTMSDQ